MPDLWPENIGHTDRRAPVDILREQAGALLSRTDGTVYAEVEYKDPFPLVIDIAGSNTQPKTPGTFRFDFRLVAPKLKGYRYTLFSISNFASLYPVYVEFEEFEEGKDKADTEYEFESLLRRIFASQKTLDLISGLRAQIQG